MDYEKIPANQGDRYGRLVIIKEVEPRIYKTYKDRRVLCQCDCGNTNIVSFHQLRNGRISSCGCYKNELMSRIGKERLKYDKEKTSSKLYSIWHGMKCRCNTNSSGSYDRYGAKGVAVCSEWNDDFTLFYDWAMSNGYSDGLTIDRINYNGIYEPSNCRWVDYKTQANNRRTNVRIEYNGENHTLAEWSRILNINKATLYNRRKMGWSDEMILSTPIKR